MLTLIWIGGGGSRILEPLFPVFCGIRYCCAFTKSLNATVEGLERVQHVDCYRTVCVCVCVCLEVDSS